MSFALSTATNRLAARHKTGAINATKRTTHRAVTNVMVRASDDGEKAQDSSAYRKAAAVDEGAGILGKIVSNLPDGRRGSAPESYGAKPRSKTLEEGRYRRPPPERVGGVSEDAVRGEDFVVVDGPSFGVGTLVGLLVAAATLGGVYLTVAKLGEGPVEKTKSARMPERDAPAPARVVATPAAPVAAEAAVAPEVALE